MHKKNLQSLNEVLTYGPIVAHDSELGLYITANQAYLNLWVGCGERGFDCVDCLNMCRVVDGEEKPHTFDELIKRAELWLEELRNEGQEEQITAE